MRLLILFLFFSTSLLAQPAGQKASDGSFIVTQNSLDYLGVKFLKLVGPSPWVLPSESLVRIKFTDGVYRRYDGELTFVIVRVLKKTGNQIFIYSDDLEIGDEVAIHGSNFLRMTENDLNSETVDSCSH